MREFAQLLFADVPAFVIGLAATVLLGMAVPSLMHRYVSDDLPPPAGATAHQWRSMTDIGDDARRGVKVIGQLEGVLFFVTFWLGAWELAAAWLAFKLGSKWESWQSIVKVPEVPPVGVDAFAYVGAKNRWASRTLQRWLLGALMNATCAFVGLVVAKGFHRIVSDAIAAVFG